MWMAATTSPPAQLTITAACPTCGADATWTDTPAAASAEYGEHEAGGTSWTIACPTCDRHRR